MTSRQRRRLIGKDMAMVFQEPTSSLNPCYPVGWQIAESLRAHHAVDRRAVRGQVIDLLRPGRHSRRPRRGSARFRTSCPAA